jgi:hypothetical protein
MRRIAYFITPHGYGHAARAAAVMAALAELDADIQFEIFTQVPAWFFHDSLPGHTFGYHARWTDAGMVQKTTLVEDVPATVRRLGEFLPFDASVLQQLAGQLNELACQLVVCDIAPLGIAAARQAGIPSLLVENFTWDWIYQGYAGEDARLEAYVSYLAQVFDSADYLIQTEPVCRPRRARLTSAPASRKARTPRHLVRQRLGIPPSAKVVMMTMGGIPWQYTGLERLSDQSSVYFIVPGAADALAASAASVASGSRPANLVLLPHHSEFFHPDLVHASDAVIGKAGYSTLAEVYWAGVPFGYIARPRFPESRVLVAYIQQEMPGLAVEAAQFEDGSWLNWLPELLARPPVACAGPNGADQIAGFIANLLS